MSRFKDMASKGWHPKGDQSMRQLIRREKPGDGLTGVKDANAHSSAPLSTLKDPSSFGPPPKHVAIYGESAGPGGNPSAHAATSGSSQSAAQHMPPAMPSRPVAETSHTPPAPPSRPIPTSSPSPAPAAAPRLPPRLPPRQNSRPDMHTPSPPPSYGAATAQANEQDQYINTQAAGRLANAGVSVPGFNIGGSYAQGGTQSQSPPPRQPAALSSPGQMDELQSRFARLGKTVSSDRTDSPPQASGSSWAQKQSALRTADSFRKDPSSVSLSDARSAASTAHNFQQRHGDQIASGVKTANGMSQRFGGADQAEQSAAPGASAAAVAAKKPKPPPPPKKKPELSAGPGPEDATHGAPPPIPLSSKPR